MKIGILHHPRIELSQPLSEEIETWLVDRGVQTWTASNGAHTVDPDLITGSSLVLVLGGDGSLLRAGRMASPYSVPVFGINLGKVGFLCEAQPDEWPNKLEKLLAGEYWTEPRLMLRAELHRNGRIINTFSALNDIVVGRGRQARVVRFRLMVNGDLVINYTADALIVATPTGSTAYSMAAGGPLLPPQLPNFVILPVAAHLSFDRALVLHEHAEIAIHLSMDHEAYLTPDGQHGILVQDEDVVKIKRSDHSCYFARIESAGYFYRRIMERLGHIRN